MDSNFNNFIQEVKSKSDIVSIIGDYIDLKNVGKNYQALCPFHQEKTPSFTVNPRNQLYHCFGCGASGDVFTFLMQIDSLTFIESLKILARKQGMELPEQSKYQRQREQERDRIFKANRFAARFYHYILKNKKAAAGARDYIKKRGFTDEMIEKFQLGYAPDRWQVLLNFLSDKGYSEKELLKAGLVSKSKNNHYFDKFRDRIIFPIMNIRGEVLAFGGRILANDETQQPKYLNSPATMIFDKSKNLYGIHEAKSEIRKKSSAIIMEGYTDVLRAHQEGIENAVASLGTAFTVEQARVFKRFAEQVFIAFDADAAGKRAALKGLDLLKKEGLQVKVISLPRGQDPDDFIAANGAETFLSSLEQSMGLVEFKIKSAVEDKQGEENEDKVALLREIIDILADIDDAVEREVYLREIANEYQVDFDVLSSEVKQALNSKQDKKRTESYTKNNRPVEEHNVDQLQKRIIKIFIDNFEYRDMIIETLEINYFDEKIRPAVSFLWQNQDKKDINSVLFRAKETLNEWNHKLLMNLAVTENIEVNRDILEGWLINFKRKQYYKKKQIIYNNIKQTSDITPDSLNKQLLFYKKLHSSFRREGII